MTLPSPAGGATTEQVGFFAASTADLAEWLVLGFDDGWTSRPANMTSMQEALAILKPGGELTRYVCVPVGRWTALISNGPRGTDVGVLPSYAARELGCRAIRVVVIDDPATYPMRALEVFGPDGPPPLALERSIVAANDGGRWVFEMSGIAYPFEDQSAYSNRAKTRRFTTGMVYAYLRELGVPVETQPDWEKAVVVERVPDRVSWTSSDMPAHISVGFPEVPFAEEPGSRRRREGAREHDGGREDLGRGGLCRPVE